MNVTSCSTPLGQYVSSKTAFSFTTVSMIQVGLAEPSNVSILPAPSSIKIDKFLPVNGRLVGSFDGTIRLVQRVSPVRLKISEPMPGFSVLTCIEICSLPVGVGSPYASRTANVRPLPSSG